MLYVCSNNFLHMETEEEEEEEEEEE